MKGTTLGFYFRGLSHEEANQVRRRLNEIAARLGYTAASGKTVGQGNAAGMLVAIADGELQIGKPAVTVRLTAYDRAVLMLHCAADLPEAEVDFLIGEWVRDHYMAWDSLCDC